MEGLSIFDQSASGFAGSTDRQIERNVYVRGDRFVEAVSVSVPAGGRILDYGCGPGRLAWLVAKRGYEVMGVDPSEAMIEEARKLETRGLRLRFESVPRTDSVDTNAAESDAYDGIICSSVIEYSPAPEVLLRRLHRCLARGGVLLLSYANSRSLWRAYAKWRFGRTAPHYLVQHNVWTYGQCKDILGRCGFDVIDGPKFFDSPFDKRAGLSLFAANSMVGTLGLVVARRRQSVG